MNPLAALAGLAAWLFAPRPAAPPAPDRALARAVGDIVAGRGTPADAVMVARHALNVASDVNPGLEALATGQSLAARLAPLIVAGMADGTIRPFQGHD